MSVYKNDQKEHFIRALNSVIFQTIPPSEIVLVIDGPIPDETGQIINDYAAKYNFMKTIWLDRNLGHGNARRLGLNNCTYDLVALMDSDDISVPDRFDKQLKCFAEDKELSIVGGYIHEFIDCIENVVSVRSVPLIDKEIKKYLKSRCPMNQVTVMFKKADVIKAGGYIDWYGEEDYYLWIRLYKMGSKFRNLNENLVYVRVDSDSYRRRGGWQYFASEARLQGYMLKHNIIGYGRYIYNLIIRFGVQVLVPNRLREYIFRKLFRIKVKTYDSKKY